MKKEWTKDTLWNFRRQIILCSLYYSDYRNSFNVDEHICCDFFDGYADYLGELMKKEEDYDKYFDFLPKFDNAENLWEFYCCHDEEPLPKEKEDDEDDETEFTDDDVNEIASELSLKPYYETVYIGFIIEAVKTAIKETKTYEVEKLDKYIRENLI